MKIRLLKPLIVVLALYLLPIGIISAVLTSPVYADETADTRTHSLDINGHKIKLILDSEGLVHEATSAPSISDDHVFISMSADEAEISALGGILSKLVDTEWDQLNASEKEEIIEALEKIEDGVEIDIEADFGAGKVLVAVIAILSTFGLPFIIIALILYYRHRKRRQRDILIGKFIDAGKEVPIEILAPSGASDSLSGNLERGIMLMGIGTGLFLFLGMLIDWGVASVALIPLFVGVARVAIWRLGDQAEKVADNQ